VKTLITHQPRGGRVYDPISFTANSATPKCPERKGHSANKSLSSVRGRASRVGMMVPRAVIHEALRHQACRTSAKTGRKENNLGPASLRNQLGCWCPRPSPRFRIFSPVANTPSTEKWRRNQLRDSPLVSAGSDGWLGRSYLFPRSPLPRFDG